MEKTLLNRKTDILFSLVIVLAVFILYSSSLTYPFIWDDEISIENNIGFDKPGYLKDIFTKHFFSAGSFQGVYSQSMFYRPMVGLSFLFDHFFWGIKAAGFRMTNIFLHIFCTLLFYFFMRRLSFQPFMCFVFAFLYGIHPAHISSVVYVSGRTDVIRTFFMFLCFFAYLDRKMIAGLFFFFCSLLSKEDAVTLPFVLFFADVFLDKKFSKRVFPYVFLSLLYMVFRKYGLHSNDFAGLELNLTYMGTVAQSVFIYARIAFFPFDLHFERFMPLLTSKIASGMYLVLLTAFIAVILRVCKNNKKALFALCSLVFIFLPVSNVVPLYSGFRKTYIFLADHFLYLPLMFTFLIVLTFVSAWNIKGRKIFYAVCVLFIFCFLIFHRQYIRVWAERETFYLHVSKRSSYPYRIYANLAANYVAKSDGRALEYLEKLKKIMPKGFVFYYITQANWYYFHEKDINKAIQVLIEGINENIYDPTLYFQLGDLYFEKGKVEEAVKIYEKGISLEKKPSYLQYFRLGFFYLQLEDQHALEKAARYFQMSYSIRKEDSIKAYIKKADEALKKKK